MMRSSRTRHAGKPGHAELRGPHMAGNDLPVLADRLHDLRDLKLLYEVPMKGDGVRPMVIDSLRCADSFIASSTWVCEI